MDRAVRELGAQLPPEPDRAGAPLRTYPLRPELLAFIQVWPEPQAASCYAAKGAPEAIFRLCRMSDDERARHGQAVVSGLASRGLRVLGVASAARRSRPPDRTRGPGFHLRGPDRLRGSGPIRCPAGRRRGEAGRDHRCDDHGRLSGHGPGDRPPGRDRHERRRAHGQGGGRPRSGDPARAGAADPGLRPHHAGAEARAGRGVEGQRRGRRHDRGRRQRRAGARSRPHRHRHGPARHRRRAGGRGSRAPRRPLRLDHRRRAARAAHLREPAQGADLRDGDPCSYRRAGPAAVRSWACRRSCTRCM